MPAFWHRPCPLWPWPTGAPEERAKNRSVLCCWFSALFVLCAYPVIRSSRSWCLGRYGCTVLMSCGAARLDRRLRLLDGGLAGAGRGLRPAGRRVPGGLPGRGPAAQPPGVPVPAPGGMLGAALRDRASGSARRCWPSTSTWNSAWAPGLQLPGAGAGAAAPAAVLWSYSGSNH